MISALPMAPWFLILALQQEGLPVRPPPTEPALAPSRAKSLTVQWAEGTAIPLRVPVLSPEQELMTTVSFPEDSVETAISGWSEGDLTAIQKRGLLFLRLHRKSEGQLSVLGASGTHYLLYLKGISASSSDAYDEYLKIEKKSSPPNKETAERRRTPRPGAALALLQAMRQGQRPEAGSILRAGRELAIESPSLEVRLLYVYESASYRGYVFEMKSLGSQALAIDASHFRSKDPGLVLTALKENLLAPGAVTRLYVITAKELQ